MNLRTFVATMAAVLIATAAQAHSYKHKQLEIVHPWCIETGDTTSPVSVFMTIKNASARPDKLLRASTSIAGKTELAAPVTVDTRSAVDLKRGGPHIRLSNVTKPLAAYDSFMMTLVFERAGKVEIEVMVEEASILEPKK